MRRQDVVETIRNRILSGEYRPGGRIPSQAELAGEFRVASRTIRVAIADLCGQGYVWTLPRKGTYVHTPGHWPAP